MPLGNFKTEEVTIASNVRLGIADHRRAVVRGGHSATIVDETWGNSPRNYWRTNWWPGLIGVSEMRLAKRAQNDEWPANRLRRGNGTALCPVWCPVAVVPLPLSCLSCPASACDVMKRWQGRSAEVGFYGLSNVSPFFVEVAELAHVACGDVVLFFETLGPGGHTCRLSKTRGRG